VSEFMKRAEVNRIHPVDDRSRVNAENAGLFPRRIRLAPNITRWRRDEIEAWHADPRAWADKNAANAARNVA
jgi:hypothetical protein